MTFDPINTPAKFWAVAYLVDGCGKIPRISVYDKEPDMAIWESQKVIACFEFTEGQGL